MPNDHTRAVPDLEAFELSLSLRKQRVCFRDGLIIGQPRQLLDGLDPARAQEIASHADISTVDQGNHALFARERALASGLEIDDVALEHEFYR
jgi:hypothetical protein